MGLFDILGATVGLVRKYHEGQNYGVVPYWRHLHAVSCRVRDTGGDSELQAIAWLHDILEDTNCTVAVLSENQMSLRVIDAVLHLTKVEGESYNDYLAKVKSNDDALIVKKWDTFCNLNQSLRDADSRRIKKYAKQLILLEE